MQRETIFNSTFAPLLLAAETDRSIPHTSKAQARRPSFAEILIALSIPILVLGAVEVIRFGDLVVDLMADSRWAPYRVSGALTLLLALDGVLVLALLLQAQGKAKVEQQLSTSADLLALCGDAGIGVWTWSPGQQRLFMSEYCAKLLSGGKTTPGGDLHHIAELAHPDDRTLLETSINRLLNTNSGFALEFRLRPASGHTQSVFIKTFPAFSETGELMRIRGIVKDITKERDLQQQIEEQRRSLTHTTRVNILGKLSGALAHELNQPLTAIMSNAQAAQRMIRRSPLDINELQAAIADIIDDDTRAWEVIRHLRAMLKDSQGDFELIDLNATTRSALELMRADFITRHVSLTNNLSAMPALVRGDAVQLQQVILNLLINGAESTAEAARSNGTLRIASEIVGSSILVSIWDNGAGIKHENFDRVFEPFFSTKDQGMGLGLSLCRSILERHNGKIWATNNTGGGAGFHFSIPLAKVS